MTDRAKELAAALRCTSTAGEGQGCTRCSFWRVALNPAVLPAGLSKADYMRTCLAMIDSADEVWTLPNATDSPGATLEIQYCAYTGKPVRPLRTVQEETEAWLATD